MQRRMMQKQKQLAWELEIEAKANDLAFGLKATKALPPPAAARRLFRFSLRLKLSSVVIHVKSKYKPSIWPKNPLEFFKSRFVAKLGDKFRRRTTPAAAARTTLNTPPPPRWMAMTIIKGRDYCGCGGGSSALLQNLYLLRQWISQKDQNGIEPLLVVNVSGWTGPIRCIASSVFKNNAGFGRKLRVLLVLLLLIAVFSPSLRCGCAWSICCRAFGIIQSLGTRIKSSST